MSEFVRTEEMNGRPVNLHARPYSATFWFQRGSSLASLVDELREEGRYKYGTDYTLLSVEGRGKGLVTLHPPATRPAVALEFIRDAALRAIERYNLNLELT